MASYACLVDLVYSWHIRYDQEASRGTTPMVVRTVEQEVGSDCSILTTATTTLELVERRLTFLPSFLSWPSTTRIVPSLEASSFKFFATHLFNFRSTYWRRRSSLIPASFSSSVFYVDSVLCLRESKKDLTRMRYVRHKGRNVYLYVRRLPSIL